jgi:hypothetical protein
MHLPRACYHLERDLAAQFPHLRPAQQHGLAVWVYGTILAHSGCQNAVTAALLLYGRFYTIRDAMREWLYDGDDKAARVTRRSMSRGALRPCCAGSCSSGVARSWRWPSMSPISARC